jgi:hypothetical protein
VQNVIPTGTVFAAALEHLNRSSTVVLLQEVIAELDKHSAQQLGKSATDAGQLRAELLACLGLLRQTVEIHQDEVARINAQLQALQGQNSRDLGVRERDAEALFRRLLESHLLSITTLVGAQVEERITAVLESRFSQLGTPQPADGAVVRRRRRRRGPLTLVLIGWLLCALTVAFGVLLGRSLLPRSASDPSAYSRP